MAVVKHIFQQNIINGRGRVVGQAGICMHVVHPDDAEHSTTKNPNESDCPDCRSIRSLDKATTHLTKALRRY